MEVLVLHILKLNIIAAVIILLVKLLTVPLKGRVSARWKYFIWLFVAVSLLIPVRVPGSISLVDLQLKKSSPDRISVQEKDISATVPENGQYISQQETMRPEKRNVQDQDFSRQKIHTVYETGKWMEMATGIFVAVWLIVAVLKLAGEFLAYHLSIRNLERMSLPVTDPVSLRMYREVCRDKRIRRMPELRQNAGLTTPLLAGLFHTKLYLPATGYSAEERKLVFYHELTHYVHGDLWYKMLLRICASIYWFNPFLLIMLKEADKDIENLCDTAVVRRVNKKEHKLYRQLLLRTVAMENKIPYVTASLNAVSYTHLNNIAPEVPQDFHEKFEETLRHIEQADAVDKKYKRKRFSGRLLIAAAVICTGMGVTAVSYTHLDVYKRQHYNMCR